MKPCGTSLTLISAFKRGLSMTIPQISASLFASNYMAGELLSYLRQLLQFEAHSSSLVYIDSNYRVARDCLLSLIYFAMITDENAA